MKHDINNSVIPPSGNMNSAGQSEIQEYLDTTRKRRWVFARAALVGACAGMIALLFRASLSGMDLFRNRMIAWSHCSPVFGWIFPVLFAMAGTLIAVLVTRRYAPEAGGSGIPHLKAVLHRIRPIDWKRILPVKFFGGIVAVGSGLALGREGPTVQMGGAIGDAVSRSLKLSERERLTLITAGAGAGLAAAFNAPLSGLVFVLEEVRRDFQPVMFGAALIAAIVADVFAQIWSGQFPIFTIPSYPVLPLASLPVFILLGVVAGAAGALFNRGLLAVIRLNGRLPKHHFILMTALTGGLVGLSGWFFPELIGSGHHLVESTLQGDLFLGVIPLLFASRFLLTIMSYGTGAPGGIFTPLLVFGALIGLAVGQVANRIAPDVVPIPAVFAVVGMAAYFTAIVRAPITGIVLIIEMTGSHSQILPLLVSCFCAYAVNEFIKESPIYEALLEHDLNKGGEGPFLKEPVVAEFTIQAGAPFEGCEVRSLGLPSGCILVRCSDGKREWVPKADTLLEAHLRLTAMIEPEAAHALEILRRGCRAAGGAGKGGLNSGGTAGDFKCP
ncbi:H(+)/Cl(-) exchange transporter ClcA [bacterium]|nr:H(+)/Cl(-) exchange transporter ClcA [bacterium]